MSAIGSSVLTLVDVAKRKNPDGTPAKIAELLSQRNEILEDMVWVEGNKDTGHVTTQRVALPTASFRAFNEGIAPSKSETMQIEESCAMLEAWSETDKDLVELSGNTGAFRMGENLAFIEAMNQTFSQYLFYGNSSTTPKAFNGFATRYNSLSGNIGGNVVTGSGAGSDNSSIWLICWGENTIHGIYPKGSQAGLKHEDLGLVTVETTAGVAGNRMRAYQDHWQWKMGLCVRDYRYAVRIPNIDISNLVAKSSAADLIELMIKSMKRIPNLKMGKPVFYMNRTCEQMLDIFRRDDVLSGGQLSYDVVDGKYQSSFRGIPIKICDQLLETESVVS